MKLKVLVACEFSGTVRDAFAALGHDAWSCDLLPTETGKNHYQCDVRDVLGKEWDLMIAHPPCTHLSASGARWWKSKQREQAEAIEFVRLLMAAPIQRWAIENPIGKLSSAIRKPDQIIQPWQFGHGETKATCLWLQGLSLLTPTNMVDGRESRIHKMSPSPTRWKERSRTYAGIATAMALQWVRRCSTGATNSVSPACAGGCRPRQSCCGPGWRVRRHCWSSPPSQVKDCAPGRRVAGWCWPVWHW